MKYRKKPVVIEAEQFFPDRKPWPVGICRTREMRGGRMVCYYTIATLEGTMEASPGDWIITGVKGEKYPIKNEIFRMTYEPVVADGSESGGS